MKKILVAEDNAGVRWLLKELLKEWGYNVTDVKDGKYALEKLEEMNFDLVLSDIEMSRINGLQLLKIVKQKYQIPVILMSCIDYIKEAEGAAAFLIKPIDFRKLESEIKKALQSDEILINCIWS